MFSIRSQARSTSFSSRRPSRTACTIFASLTPPEAGISRSRPAWTPLTRSATEQLRSAIYALNHPADAGRSTLPELLEQLATVHMPEDLRVVLKVEGAVAELPSATEHALLRVAGEALFNHFPQAKEGQLSRLRARLVKGETLAVLARGFELGDRAPGRQPVDEHGGHREAERVRELAERRA